MKSKFYYLIVSIGLVGAISVGYYVPFFINKYPGASITETANIIIIWITVIVLIIYTWETKELKKSTRDTAKATIDLKEVTRKQLVENRRSLYLNLRPFIRLQWSQISNYKNKNYGLWHIKIINEAEGIAINFRMSFSHDKTVITRTLIAGHKTYLPVTEPNYQDFKYKDESSFLAKFGPQNNYKIILDYKDVSSLAYKQVFKTDQSEDSKFKLIQWDMPEVFKKIDKNMVEM